MGKPDPAIEWLSDNESIYTALETVIEAERHHLVPITTPVASPEFNGMAEAFVNTFAPHSSLGMKTPTEFRRDQQTVADTGCLTK